MTYETEKLTRLTMVYDKDIQHLIPKLNKLTGVEWRHELTGDGCDCLEYATEKNTYIITDGQESIPVDDDFGYILGIYFHDLWLQPDPLAEFDTETLTECATKFRELLASNTKQIDENLSNAVVPMR